MFLQQLITGLSVGSIYALMAVGYSLIYSLLNFTNFAHGASVLIGAYVGYSKQWDGSGHSSTTGENALSLCNAEYGNIG